MPTAALSDLRAAAILGRPMDHIDRNGFRANVGIVLMHDDGRVFLGRRVGGRGWQFPQGGIRLGEEPRKALYRELEEEIGLKPDDVHVVAATQRWLRYRLPSQFVRRDQHPRCIGQKQRWFLLKLRESWRAQFRFDSSGTPEFDQWRWAPFWDPVREVIHFKRKVYQQALHELGQTAFPDGLPPYPAWWPEAA
jgi:putative (di)nucleoside polyphosphate hydrolase